MTSGHTSERKFDIRKHYNKFYSRNDFAFGSEAELFVKYILKYIYSGYVIDLGAGEGRNSIYLSSKGFRVKAVDISSVAIKKLDSFTKRLNLRLETKREDIRTMKLPKNCDVFLSTFVMHHFTKREGVSFIKKIKTKTPLRKFNVIIVFTNDGDFYRSAPNKDRFLLVRGGLRRLYHGWKILQYKEWRTRAFTKKADGGPMFNIAAGVIAQKI